jgi:hypothetical protein
MGARCCGKQNTIPDAEFPPETINRPEIEFNNDDLEHMSEMEQEIVR